MTSAFQKFYHFTEIIESTKFFKLSTVIIGLQMVLETKKIDMNKINQLGNNSFFEND